METKVCSKCGVTQNVLEFRKDITKKDGLRPDCKLCVKSYEMSRRNDVPTMMKEKLKNFYKHNPEKRKEYRKNYKLRKQEQRKERRENDPVFNLINRMRCRIWKYLNILEITKKIPQNKYKCSYFKPLGYDVKKESSQELSLDEKKKLKKKLKRNTDKEFLA
jgi:hypothetical protein